MATRPPDDDRASIIDLLRHLTEGRHVATRSEATRLRQHFARHVLPDHPTTRVREKHAQHVEDDQQWPDDHSADEYLETLRATILDHRGGIYLAEPALEPTWTIYFVGPVPYRSRGRHPGQRIVVLFNAERLFWITGFQADAGDAYVDRRPGFWAHHPR